MWPVLAIDQGKDRPKANHWGKRAMSCTTTFTYTGSSIVTYVPATGLYDIKAFGAKGVMSQTPREIGRARQAAPGPRSVAM